jgi:hypothetical protein
MYFSKLINNYHLSGFNKKFFQKNINLKKKKILVEFYEFTPTTIPFSYFANILAKKYDAEINAYRINFYTFNDKIKFFVKQFIFNYRNLYKSFGSKKIILPEVDKVSEKEKKYILNLIKKIKTKNDLLNLKFKGIPIGDYLYDEYLRSFNKITINLETDHFKNYLLHSLKLTNFWFNKLDPKYIKSVIISHTAYLIGLIGTIAIYKKIPTYRVSLSSCFYLTKKNPKQFSNFHEYPSIIKRIDKKVKNPQIKQAKKKIIKYFLKKDLKILKKPKNNNNNNLNVLVSAHCFTDAVHVHGIKNCFSDYYEWIDYIGKTSLKSRHNWLIKLHPSEYDNNLKNMNYFLKKYPHLKLVKKNTKNLKLINNIDVVLTVYGTVGREFPLFGIPVINASTCGPHSGYKFNHHFDNIHKYNKAITNLQKYTKNFKIDKSKVLEFYYLRYCLDFSFLFNSKYINEINENLRIKNLHPHSVSEIWLKDIKSAVHLNIFDQVKEFINSKQYRFTANNNDEYSSFIKLNE